METIAYFADQMVLSFAFMFIFDAVLLGATIIAARLALYEKGSGEYDAIIPLGNLTIGIILLQLGLSVFHFLGHKYGKSVAVILFIAMIVYAKMIISFLMAIHGYKLTKFRPHWLRELEYLYTIITAASLLKLVLSRSGVDNIESFELISIFGLAFAIALKLAKVGAEIKRYDLPDYERPGFVPSNFDEAVARGERMRMRREGSVPPPSFEP